MSRTNIDIDDELIAEAMRKYGLRTKKEAVDLALRRLVGPRLSPEFLKSLRGSAGTGISTPCAPAPRRQSSR